MDEKLNEFAQNAKEHRPKDLPIVETLISTSKDGKWIIHKTVFTDIKPATYYGKMLEKKSMPKSGGKNNE